MQIYTVGETLLDIIFKGIEPKTAKPGGSAFNTSITLGRLEAPVHFISEIGLDKVGDMIRDFMKDNGVETNYVSRFRDGKSAVSLAFLDENNDAEYEFYTQYPSQRMAIEFPEFQENDLFLFGSIFALNPMVRPRVKDLLEKARKAGATIIYDPNFRSAHATERDDLVPVIRENMQYATIIRASNEDLINIFECRSPDDAWSMLSSYTDALVYTANAGGVYLRTRSLSFHMKVDAIEPVSTIGAGDTFNAGLLFSIWKKGYKREEIRSLDREQWEALITTAIRFSREVCLSYDNYLPSGFAEHYKKNM